MGQTNDARVRLAAALTAANVVVVNDARDARPLSAIIDPPTITHSSTNQTQLSFPVNVVMPPPGNLDALIALLNLMDVVMLATGATDATPTVYTAGNQELPAYTVTVPWVAYP